MFAELNNGGVDWGIDNKDFPYKKISEIDTTKQYVVKGCFINRNKTEKELKEFGASVVLIMDGFNLSIPNHYETAVKTILESPEKIEAIKSGHCAIGGFYTYESHGKTCHAFKWLDV